MNRFEKTDIVRSYSSDVITRKIEEYKKNGWTQIGSTIHQKDSRGNDLWIVKFVKVKK